MFLVPPWRVEVGESSPPPPYENSLFGPPRDPRPSRVRDGRPFPRLKSLFANTHGSAELCIFKKIRVSALRSRPPPLVASFSLDSFYASPVFFSFRQAPNVKMDGSPLCSRKKVERLSCPPPFFPPFGCLYRFLRVTTTAVMLPPRDHSFWCSPLLIIS